ncbi:MAG: discoidin domain-containing protein [Chloroflexota bacterium]|nr:discoidin domain-containing protein [Chloroflexota bacterium]
MGRPTAIASGDEAPASQAAPHREARSAQGLVAATVIAGILNYALNIILSWVLPTGSYGRAGVSQALIFLCVWFLATGYPWIVNRAIAQAGGEGPEDSARGADAWRTYKSAWVASSLFTAAVALGLLIVYRLFWLGTDPLYEPLIVAIVITVAALGLSMVPAAALQGLFRYTNIAFIRVAEAVGSMLMALTLVALGFGAFGVLLGFAFGGLLVLSLNIFSLRDENIWQVPGWSLLANVWSSLPVMLAIFGGVLLTNIDLLAVKLLSGGDSDALAGAYQVAAIPARGPLLIGMALVGFFYPRIVAEMGGPHEGRSAQALMRWLGLCVLPLNVAMIVGAPQVVHFFYPETYASSSLTLALLAIGSGAMLFACALAAISQATPNVKGPTLMMLIVAATQILALAALVPAFGATGAAVATAAAGLMACGLLQSGLKHLPLRLLPLEQGAVLLFLGVLLLPLTLLLPNASRLLVVIWIGIALLVYLAACFFLGLLDAVELRQMLRSSSFHAVAPLAEPVLKAGETLTKLGVQVAPQGIATALDRGIYSHPIESIPIELEDEADEEIVPASPVRQQPGSRNRAALLALIIFFASCLLGSFRQRETVDLNADEATYAIASVALAQTGNTLWNGAPFYVHPPLFFAIESIYFRALGIGSSPLFHRLVDKPYTNGQALLPPDATLSSDNVLNAIIAGRYLSILYGALLGVVIFLFGRVLFGTRAGVAAATIFLIDPYVLALQRFNTIEPLAALLGMLMLYVYYATLREGDLEGKRGRQLLIGLLFGLALLSQELALIYFVVLLVHALLFKRARPSDLALPAAVGLAIYALFPIWAALHGGIGAWLDAKVWAFKRVPGNQGNVGLYRPGSSTQNMFSLGLQDYWTSFLIIGAAAALVAFFVYLYSRRRLRSRPAEMLAASVIGCLGFLVPLRLFGVVINQQFLLYLLMPAAILTVATVPWAWPHLGRALVVSGTQTGAHPAAANAPWWRGTSAARLSTGMLGGAPPVLRHLRVGQGLLYLLVALLVYDSLLWIERYGFSRDDSYAQVENKLAELLPAGAGVVGRDALDVYLLPRQNVYTAAFSSAAVAPDPVDVVAGKIPYAILSDKSLFSRYGGANENYYSWVSRYGDRIVSFQGSVWGTGAYHLDYSKPGITSTSEPGNMAIAKMAYASSTEDPTGTTLGPQNAFDGRLSTRWASHSGDNSAWLYVDLGEHKVIHRVRIDWEQAYASSYSLQVSDDAQKWTNFYSTDKGPGGTENLQGTTQGRYVRLLMTKRARGSGYSVWELGVYP